MYKTIDNIFHKHVLEILVIYMFCSYYFSSIMRHFSFKWYVLNITKLSNLVTIV